MTIGCRAAGAAAGVFVMLMIGATPGRAATLPTGFTEALVASGLNNPTAMQFAPDGRLFVCEQGGRLRVIKNGALLRTPFLTVTVSSSGERGLLGVAFDPNFAVNQLRLRLLHRDEPDRSQSHQPLHRQRRRRGGRQRSRPPRSRQPEQRDQSQRRRARTSARTESSTSRSARTPTRPTRRRSRNLLGKMLRLNTDGTIPTDNPFYASATGKNRAIWALGLRNPFTFAFSPSGSSMFINDVGQTTWEEINDGARRRELRLAGYRRRDDRPALRQPALQLRARRRRLRHHRRRVLPPPPRSFRRTTSNDYFFADYCAGWIRRLDPANGNAVTDVRHRHRFAGRSESGRRRQSLLPRARERRHDGVVYRVSYGATAPTITSQPSSRSVAPGASVTFSVRASGPAPLRYQWQRNGANISGATVAGLHARVGRDGRQRRALPRRRLERLRQHHQRRGRADGDLEPGAHRHDHLACGGHALQRRKHHQLTRAPAPIPKTARSPRAPSPGGSTSITTHTAIRSWPRPRA